MHYISIVFVSMKTFSTILTFVFVRGDADIMWIPILDMLSSVVAILITLFFIFFKLKLKIKIVSISLSFKMLKESSFYFISNMATTAFGALNTLLIGIFIYDKAEIAYWSVCCEYFTEVSSINFSICMTN